MFIIRQFAIKTKARLHITLNLQQISANKYFNYINNLYIFKQNTKGRPHFITQINNYVNKNNIHIIYLQHIFMKF